MSTSFTKLWTLNLCYGVHFSQLTLQESLTQDYDAKYWRQRYSLKDGIPSFLANISGTILTTGKYLNVMRECGHHVQVQLYLYLGMCSTIFILLLFL